MLRGTDTALYRNIKKGRKRHSAEVVKWNIFSKTCSSVWIRKWLYFLVSVFCFLYVSISIENNINMGKYLIILFSTGYRGPVYHLFNLPSLSHLFIAFKERVPFLVYKSEQCWNLILCLVGQHSSIIRILQLAPQLSFEAITSTCSSYICVMWLTKDCWIIVPLPTWQKKKQTSFSERCGVAFGYCTN